MRYRKIHILGAAGSGKSYIAGLLSRTYGLSVFDLDDLFWDNRAGGYGVMADAEERDSALETILEQEAWIIEGSYCRWVFRGFEEAEIIIIMTTPRWLREWRIVRRFLQRKLGLIPSKKRETLRALWRVLKWNHRYETNSLPFAYDLIKLLERKAVHCRTWDDVVQALSE
jgi:adenylate kinase family enzyme